MNIYFSCCKTLFPFFPWNFSTPSQISEFETLTETLPSSRKEALLNYLEMLKDKEVIFQQMVELANTRNYTHFSSLFLDRKFEYYALGAVQERHLTAIQFGSLMFARAALNGTVTLDQFEAVPLFGSNAPNPAAWNTLAATLKTDNFPPALTLEQLSSFFELMRQQPVSEQYFTLIPDRRVDRNVTNSINQKVGFNLFCGVLIKNKKMRIIPSYGMVKALIDLTGTDGFTFKLVLGPSSPDTLRLAILQENAREICIHCNELSPAPSLADSVPSPPLDFMYHDIYHLWCARGIPKAHREFYCELAGIIHPNQYNKLVHQHIASLFYNSLVDLEMMVYRIELRNSDFDLCSHKVIDNLVHEYGPQLKQHYYVNTDIDPNLVEECEIFFDQIKNKIAAFYALWKTHNKKIEQLIPLYEALDFEWQERIGEEFLRYEAHLEKN